MLEQSLAQQRGMAGMYRGTPFEAKAAEARFAESITVPPYLPFLLHRARRMAPVFDERMRVICGAIGGGTTYQAAPIKGFTRCLEKVREDYSHLDLAMPSSAHLLDVVRGLFVCPTVDDMVRTFAAIEAHAEVTRVKNGFRQDTVPFNFRQILVNVRLPCPLDDAGGGGGDAGGQGGGDDGGGGGGGGHMICEVQLNLSTHVKVKHQIHRFYSILRCEKESGIDMQISKKAFPF